MAEAGDVENLEKLEKESDSSDTRDTLLGIESFLEEAENTASVASASEAEDEILVLPADVDLTEAQPSVGGQSHESITTTSSVLPWGARKEKMLFPAGIPIDTDVKPGEFVMRTLFAEFVIQVERKIEMVMAEPLERPLSKSLQRGEDPVFDQLLGAFSSVAEHCLPSLLRALFAWYERQVADTGASLEQKQKPENKNKNLPPTSDALRMDILRFCSDTFFEHCNSEPVEKSEKDYLHERRDLAIEFIFCLLLIEVLKQLPVHPGHEDHVGFIESLAFRHFKFRECAQAGINATSIHIIADLYAEVIGVLAQSRFQSVRKIFMSELKELRSKEPSPVTTQTIISLLMGMKFFRVKMVPIEEFEASFQFMQECAQYFLEVKDKDIKHALAGLFVEILVPVAATVKNEVNVPVLKNFVEMLYSQTLDMATKKKHSLALFPLVTCLLCVSQKTFFLQNWHYFLAMCLSHLKNRDPKMSRVALESLYRLLWVYMIRIKCESNTATQSRLQSIVNSLFPKGSKAVVPRETPLNIFVKIIQFVAQERLDFAMKEIVFDLLSVGRPIKIILTPERMSIGLRAFLVVADSLQQKEGDPPMPRTIGVLPSGNTLRVKKTFLNKMLTEDTAKSIGISSYYPYVRKAFNDILRALDVQFGRPLMMTNVQNVNKEPDDMITGERKAKIDLFRTCVAAIPRLIPDGMSRQDLVDLLSRLTVHWDEELRGLAFQSLQNLVLDFPDWREDVVYGFVQFVLKEVNDTFTQLLDNNLRMLLQILTSWRNALTTHQTRKESLDLSVSCSQRPETVANVVHCVEGFALVVLCNSRLAPRRLAVHILKELKVLTKILGCVRDEDQPVVDILDKACPLIIEKVLHLLPAPEKAAVLSSSTVDLQWLSERTSSVWTAGHHDTSTDGFSKNHASNSTSYDVWAIFLAGFLEQKGCPTAFAHAWPVVYSRLNSLFTVVDPNPINDNRASLLRSATTIKKPPNERDSYLGLWRNYVMFACRVIPPNVNPVIRCASPDLSLSSSPDSMASDRSDSRSPSSSNISPIAFYKLIVPLLRCEASDIRDSVVNGLGRINPDAIRDLMEELVVYIREAIDRKQENMRRRRRRDALRVQLVRVFELIAENGTFGKSPSVLDGSSLHPTFVEYIDGARQYLESENDKDVPVVQEIKSHFCGFVCKLIKSFPLESRSQLLSRNLRHSLFLLFASWSGKFGVPFGFSDKRLLKEDSCTEFELEALQSMSVVVCCGSVFDPQGLSEEGNIYSWLDTLLETHDEKIYQLAQETIVLLLEFNPDMNSLLDWVVDRCYTGSNEVADGCFSALATVFSAREYPCDHYTAIINVTLMNTGCPRAPVHETALQLLQILDKRFFGSPLVTEFSADDQQLEIATNKRESTLDVLLSATYSRSQMYLSKQLASLHPELTMPMFSEVTHRFQTARRPVRQLLLQYLLPWLYNMELVDPNIPPVNPLSQFLTKMQEYYISDTPKPPLRREGWGSAEATEMVLNNLFYITAKFGDDHPKEIEELWAALCSCWPNNLKVIIRYLFIISGMAPNELLFCAKRVVVYLGRARPERLVDEMMNELQTVETLNCLIERTETPPFFRVTSMRKTSSHSDATSSGTQADAASRSELGVEKGTIHTKRHSGEDPLSKDGSTKGGPSSHGSLRSTSSVSSCSSCRGDQVEIKLTSASGHEKCGAVPEVPVEDDNFLVLRRQGEEKPDMPLPYPLPMPEYGGYFAPLTEFLPDSSQPISGFHRCNLAVMLLTDLVVDGIDVDWSVHIPLMLHIIFLGLDHTRALVYEHCKKLLMNLLIVLSNHNDHLTIARILLNNKTEQQGYGLVPPGPLCQKHNFTEPGFDIELCLQSSQLITASPTGSSLNINVATINNENSALAPPDINSDDQVSPASTGSTENMSAVRTEDIVKSLIDFIASRKSHSLWSYEDITSRVWNIRSAEQLESFLRHVLQVFKNSQPHAHIEERWAQIALQLALSCSSRHYAGRSLQIFRALRVPITTRLLSDILSRLVETVAEQGEDMQGYVTEIMLTLEAAVDCLDSDFRPIDFVKELFKSTPNLNKDNRKSAPTIPVSQSYHGQTPQPGHTRSTSYSVSFCTRKPSGSPTAEMKDFPAVLSDVRARSSTESDARIKSTNLSRSRSAQSLKMMADQSGQDDKMTILSQLFWIAVSMLESDYEYEFLLAMRLLERVLKKFPLDRPDCHEKVEKLQQQLKWNNFPGVHALLLKGCTSPLTFEATLNVLSKFTVLMDIPVVDPTQSLGFPMNVIALLPYMLQNYEDPNPLCIVSAESIAQVCLEKSKKLENLATVMTLYSRRTFSKESFQWTKCVVKYLYDTYAHLSLSMMIFLVEVLEKGPPGTQQAILSIIHCMLHYQDVNITSVQSVNGDVLRVIAKYVEELPYWKEALKILKLVVTRCSTLAAPPLLPSHFGETMSIASHTSFAEAEVCVKKELPGRTMEFNFDVTQLQVIGSRFIIRQSSKDDSMADAKSEGSVGKAASPHRSMSFTQSSNDNSIACGWKKPWMSQARTRECLVNLLTSCGQRVGLPKSPSVIFSQTSDIVERQSSMASSTEEVSVINNAESGDSKLDDSGATDQQFGVFKDFDFLEYELESQEGESMDKFNWVMRRPSLSNIEGGDQTLLQDTGLTGSAPNLNSQREESSDDELGSGSPVDDSQPDLGSGHVFHPSSLLERRRRQSSPTSGSSHSICSDQDLGDLTPSNNSPNFALLVGPYINIHGDELEEAWRTHVVTLMNENTISIPTNTYGSFTRLFKEMRRKFVALTQECCHYLGMSESLRLVTPQFHAALETVSSQVECPFVFIDPDTVQSIQVLDKHKFSVLELQEHLETYFDKRDHTVECLDGIKSALKLHSMGETLPDFALDEQLVEMCRSLYKLHFQLLLLFESYCKLIGLLTNLQKQGQVADLSKEVTVLKHDLLQAITETDNECAICPPVEPVAPSRIDAELFLYELLSSKQLSRAFRYVRSNRSHWPVDLSGHGDEEEIELLLTIYCRNYTEKRAGVLVITKTEHDLSELCNRLMDVNIQLSASVRALERVAKLERERAESSIRKTEC